MYKEKIKEKYSGWGSWGLPGKTGDLWPRRTSYEQRSPDMEISPMHQPTIHPYPSVLNETLKN